MLRKDLVDYLNSYLKIAEIEDFCPNGLQISGKEEILKVATAVTANLQTIESAVEQKVDALIVHHGIFWNKDPYPIVGSKYEKIKLLIENGISLLAYHLPLDVHQEVGNNWKAAKDLGWKNLEASGFFNGAPIGVKGTFSPVSVNAFKESLEKYYEHPAFFAPHGKDKVQSACLISGGAYKELFSVAQEGVDCFITGNFDEPAWGISYEENIHFFALGHHATEKVGPRELAKHLQKKYNIPTLFLNIQNPF